MIKIHQTKDSRKPKVRFVPMTPMAAAAYKVLAAGKENDAPLCTNRNGEPLYEMRYWFLRALEAIGPSSGPPALHAQRQSAVKQRFLLKNGITWFWNRSATALVCVPE